MAESKIVATLPSIMTVKPINDIALTNITDQGMAITEYETIEFSGGKLTNVGSGILIGSGVSLVEVSAGIDVQVQGPTNHRVNLHIYKGGVYDPIYGADTYPLVTTGSNRCYINKSHVLMSVTEGDVIQLGVNASTTDTLKATQSYLTVKVVY